MGVSFFSFPSRMLCILIVHSCYIRKKKKQKMFSCRHIASSIKAATRFCCLILFPKGPALPIDMFLKLPSQGTNISSTFLLIDERVRIYHKHLISSTQLLMDLPCQAMRNIIKDRQKKCAHHLEIRLESRFDEASASGKCQLYVYVNIYYITNHSHYLPYN